MRAISPVMTSPALPFVSDVLPQVGATIASYPGILQALGLLGVGGHHAV